MRKTYILPVVFILSACSFLDRNAILRVEQTQDRKLPALEAVYIDATSSIPHYWEPGAKVVQSGTDRATLFYKQVENVLTNPHSDIHGYIELRDHIYPTDIFSGLLWIIPSCFTYGLANLLGMPLLSQGIQSEIHIRVLDKEGRLVKRYYAEAKDTQYVALYWAKQGDYALKTYRDALDDAVLQMQQDYEFLYERLK